MTITDKDIAKKINEIRPRLIELNQLEKERGQGVITKLVSSSPSKIEDDTSLYGKIDRLVVVRNTIKNYLAENYKDYDQPIIVGQFTNLIFNKDLNSEKA